MLAASASHQANLGALICEVAGLAGQAEGVTAVAAEASGAAALNLGWQAIRSGMVDVAAVVGVEKVTDVVGAGEELNLLGASLDSDYEASEGLTPAGQAALLLQRYLYENQFPREVLQGFAMIARNNAVNNPNAMFRRALTGKAYNKAATAAAPLNAFDLAAHADGAAALILTRAELVPKNLAHKPIKLLSSSLIAGRLAVHDRQDPLFFEAAAVSARQACLKANIPLANIDFFEYSDNSTLHALLSLEAAGFAPRGQAWKLAMDASLTLEGSLPVATMGGHMGRGFPLGASGVYQAVEASLQLRGEAGTNQIAHARYGMIQSLAGTGSAAGTHILAGLRVEIWLSCESNALNAD
jgi:acetyl-CoA C-acetyltransferase